MFPAPVYNLNKRSEHGEWITHASSNITITKKKTPRKRGEYSSRGANKKPAILLLVLLHENN